MAFSMYSLLSPGLIIFLLNIDYIPSSLTSGWAIINFILGFLFKKGVGMHKGELAGVLAVRMLLFMDNKGDFIDIGDPCWDGLCMTLTPFP